MRKGVNNKEDDPHKKKVEENKEDIKQDEREKEKPKIRKNDYTRKLDLYERMKIKSFSVSLKINIACYERY